MKSIVPDIVKSVPVRSFIESLLQGQVPELFFGEFDIGRFENQSENILGADIPGVGMIVP